MAYSNATEPVGWGSGFIRIIGDSYLFVANVTGWDSSRILKTEFSVPQDWLLKYMNDVYRDETLEEVEKRLRNQEFDVVFMHNEAMREGVIQYY